MHIYARICSYYVTQLIYDTVPDKQREAMHERRLRKYLEFVKTHSPYYARQLENIDVRTCNLSDIPPIDKKLVMSHYDELVMDRDVTLEGIQSFIHNPDNKKKSYLDRYKIARTSGSTWIPTVIPYNEQMRAHYLAATMRRFHIKHKPYASVFADPGFTLGSLVNLSTSSNYQYYMVDAVQPVDQLVAQLNKIKPKHIQSFTGTLIMLAHEAEEGRLNLHLKAIGATGEDLYQYQREYLQSVFGCPVYSVYNASEMGHVATDCSHGHLHYYNDYLQIEPVDENNNPVPDGVESDHILVTNMLSEPLPIVRYELGDKLIVHREGCPCGSRHPWIELCGRSGIRGVEFHRDGKSHFIPMLTIRKRCFEEHRARSVQLIVHDEHHFEARFKIDYEGTWDEFRRHTEESFLALFREHGIDDVSVEVRDCLPIPDPVTGKVKNILSFVDGQSA